MTELTDRQRQVYDYIARCVAERGSAPTLQEIAAHLGVSGNLGVLRHLEALEKKGYLRRRSGRSRGIVLTRRGVSHSLPLVGSVAAGPLSEALEEVEEYMDIDASLVRGEGS
ncbi:MAG: LexA family transcriptional regulator, partial [Desulfuromonas sp.]